jgi:hypothetical protein
MDYNFTPDQRRRLKRNDRITYAGWAFFILLLWGWDGIWFVIILGFFLL